MIFFRTAGDLAGNQFRPETMSKLEMPGRKAAAYHTKSRYHLHGATAPSGPPDTFMN